MFRFFLSSEISAVTAGYFLLSTSVKTQNLRLPVSFVEQSLKYYTFNNIKHLFENLTTKGYNWKM